MLSTLTAIFLPKLLPNRSIIVFANEEEEAQIALPVRILKRRSKPIANMCEIAVVKIGSKGSFVKRGTEKVKVDAIKATAVDTTGAGDLFASGFLYGLTQGWSLEKCARLGSLTAGKVVECIGAKISQEVWVEINRKKSGL